MKLLNRLTIQNLKLNKKRTIVTIIGIILATALITGVATLVACFQASTKEYVRETSGNYHYEFLNVPGKDIEEIENMENIENVYLTENLGYSEKKTTNDEINEDKTNLEDLQFQVLGFSKGAMENLGITLDEGRFPENENEIVISNYVETRTDIEIEPGKEITLTIKDEDTEQENTKTYKVVGTVNITDDRIEARYVSTPEGVPFYYTAITYLENYTDESKLNVYVNFKNLKNRLETTAQILGVDEEKFNGLKSTNISKTEYNLLNNETNKYECYVNNSLVALESGDFDEDSLDMIYTLATIILAIIIITSVYCIKNSFNISITEKVKEYGILSSIGATSKQIRKNVLYEAFILAIIAIPIGIILGVGLIYVALKIIEQVLGEELFGMKFIFATNLSAIILTIILSGITIYLSARKSAKIASKISPMEAIRSNQDVKIKSKKIRAPKIIKKLFGIGGDIAYKNLNRNSRKYRTTVVSITVSVTIFIAMISFTSYAFKISDLYYADYNYNVYVYDNDYEKLKEISEDPNVSNFSLARNVWADYEDNGEHHSKEAEEANYFWGNKKLSFQLVAVGEQEYNRFIKELGLKYEDVKDKAVLYDYKNEITDAEGNSIRKILRISNYKEGDVIHLYQTYPIYDNENKDNIISIGKREFDIEIAKVTDKIPPFGAYSNTSAFLIVSDEFLNENQLDSFSQGLYMNVENDVELVKYLKENYPTVTSIGDIDEDEREQKAMITTVAVCLYTFIAVISLIGITNIFNTITTSMELRQKEFAVLKSIGMTKKEFNRMIRLESIFYGTKSLIIGVPLGIIISYIIYKAFLKGISVDYVLPINGIIIAIVAVFVLIGAIMKYSLKKINKQNIIETIRNDNV